MKRRGFALLELVIVIGIIGTIAGMSVPLYRDYQIRNDLNLATEQVTQGLARARLLSQSAQNDDGWGFYVPAGVLYKGASYAARDTTFDETYPMPSTITPSGLFEVAYSKLKGQPSETGNITLTALNKEQRTVAIKVEKEAIPVVVSDSLTICHKPNGQANNTITISDSAWPAHRNHGDTLGPCPGTSSSSAAASSVASAASSARSSSSAAGGAGASSSAAACTDRFSVAADGTITTTGPLSIIFNSMGAQFGYGNGGPTVPVTVAYKKTNNGNSWTNLFSGNAINGNGGATQTVTGFTNGDKVILKFRAYYHQVGWLTYDNTIYSNDGSKSVIVLRNGDTAPTIAASGGQTSISTLIQSITVNGKINIGQYDLLLLADFNRASCTSCSNNYCSNCSGVDYQDGVVLVKFQTPSC
jgi:prepilin-type N-terminal cleavage/methylation domain-containing protein